MTPRTHSTRHIQPWYEWLVPGDWKDYPPTSERVTGDSIIDGELTKSSSHPFFLLGTKRGPLDIGGDFKVIRRAYEETSSLDGPAHFSIWNPWYHPLNSGVNHLYVDPKAVIAFADQDHIDIWREPPHVSSGTELDVWGTKAIARCIPTNPVAEAQILAGNTLQKGLPAIPISNWRGITDAARKAGSNYINVQFGWKPFVTDLQNLAKAMRERDEILSRYHAESGKLLHRAMHFPKEVIVETDPPRYDLHPKPFGDGDYFRPDNYGKLSVTSTTTIERWFSGAFTYYLPKMGSLAGSFADARKLLGAGITPELVWELTPWSWAVNWFVDTDSVIHNLSQFTQDGLVMPYAYIMEHSKTVVEYSLTGVAFKSYPGRHSFSQTFTVECKQRRAATPWGFGATFDGFTDHQKAIIAALTISHSSGPGTINPKYL